MRSKHVAHVYLTAKINKMCLTDVILVSYNTVLALLFSGYQGQIFGPSIGLSPGFFLIIYFQACPITCAILHALFYLPH